MVCVKKPRGLGFLFNQNPAFRINFLCKWPTDETIYCSQIWPLSWSKRTQVCGSQANPAGKRVLAQMWLGNRLQSLWRCDSLVLFRGSCSSFLSRLQTGRLAYPLDHESAVWFHTASLTCANLCFLDLRWICIQSTSVVLKGSEAAMFSRVGTTELHQDTKLITVTFSGRAMSDINRNPFRHTTWGTVLHLGSKVKWTTMYYSTVAWRSIPGSDTAVWIPPLLCCPAAHWLLCKLLVLF